MDYLDDLNYVVDYMDFQNYIVFIAYNHDRRKGDPDRPERV